MADQAGRTNSYSQSIRRRPQGKVAMVESHFAAWIQPLGSSETQPFTPILPARPTVEERMLPQVFNRSDRLDRHQRRRSDQICTIGKKWMRLEIDGPSGRASANDDVEAVTAQTGRFCRACDDLR